MTARNLFAILVVMLFLTIGYIPAIGADPAQDKSQYFSNDDIEKYKRPDDKMAPVSKPATDETKETAARAKKQLKDQDEWCKRATIQKRNIETEKEIIKKLEANMSPAKSPNTYSLRKKNINHKKIESAKSRLTKAENELNALENEAHRKGIPPGWLRCDFD